MQFTKVISILAVGMTVVVASPVANSGLALREAAPVAAPLPILAVRENNLPDDLGTIFAGLDGLIGTISAAIDNLLKTFFAGGSGAEETADLITKILGQTPVFAKALVAILNALKGCD